MRKGKGKHAPRVGIGIRFSGIKYAAATLGVAENHLRMVLSGVRESKTLTERVRKQFPALLLKRAS